DDGSLYLAMEWLDGLTLAERLDEGSMELEEVVALGISAAEALDVAHRAGVVHRDVKPGNFMLVGGDRDAVKLSDFGGARSEQGRHAITQSGDAVGTPGFMAPEQARGDDDIDGRADVFALGCLLFQCLAGRPVFVGGDVLAVLAKLVLEEAPRLRSFRPDVPSALDALIARMLDKSRDERPASAAEVLSMLAQIAELGEPPPPF